MKLDPKIIEAAKVDADRSILVQPSPQARARRVLKAASENVPDEVVDAACARVDELVGLDGDVDRGVVRAALSAGLDKMAEEE